MNWQHLLGLRWVWLRLAAAMANQWRRGGALNRHPDHDRRRRAPFATADPKSFSSAASCLAFT